METNKLQNLTITAIICAISIVFFVLGIYIPFLSLITIVGIPFATCLVDLKTDIKHVLIYVLATILISSLINFQDALFYVIPSLLTGVFYGVLIKNKIHGFLSILITSIFSMGLQLLSIELINGIYSINFIEALSNFFLIEITKVESLKFLLLFLVGLIQNILIFFILESELPKFNYSAKNDFSIFYPLLIISIVTSLLGIILNKIIPSISYLMTGISLLAISNLCFYYFKAKAKWIFPSFIILIFIDFFSFIFFNDYLNNNGYYLYFNIITLSLCLIGVILIIDKVIINKSKLDNDLFIEENIKEGE